MSNSTDKQSDMIIDWNAFGLNKTFEASIITDCVVSVVRDRAISSQYGYDYSLNGSQPNLREVFQEEYSSYLKESFERYSIPRTVLLFGGHGDLIGQLARLLILCNERSSLSGYAAEANNLIARFNLKDNFAKNNDYIKHLRDAIVHSHYETHIDKSNPENSRVIFADMNQRTKETTAILSFTSAELNDLIELLIKDVFIKYLNDVGWQIE